MTLQYKFFSIPVTHEQDGEEELNAFLRRVRLINIYREMVCQDGRHYWAVTAEYTIEGEKDARRGELAKRKIDYKEELSPEDFAVFAKLRDWRKETALKEAVQLYTIFMNEQLAAMVSKRAITKNALLEIDGVGSGKVEKYGEAVLAILNAAFNRQGGQPDETSQEPLRQDSGT